LRTLFCAPEAAVIFCGFPAIAESTVGPSTHTNQVTSNLYSYAFKAPHFYNFSTPVHFLRL
jgi:hypothetical protein